MTVAKLTTSVRFRISPIGRATLWLATQLARIGTPVPHAFVLAVMNRSWRMQIGRGPWQSIRIDNAGRIQ